MSDKIHKIIKVPADCPLTRLDQALAQWLPDYSRTQIKAWIEKGEILINDKVPKAKTKLFAEDIITLNATPKAPPQYAAEAIPLHIIYEDEALIIINKPINLVVHPGNGNPNKTLLNALLHHAPELNSLPRAGILHRLDKNTSGLLIIAKTAAALKALSLQLNDRSLGREYHAIVNGVLISGGTVEAPIGRHPFQRKQMAVTDKGKEAITHYRVSEKYRAHTRLTVRLETGRTHQIRVHMAHIRHALLGDPTYGPRLQLPKGASTALIDALRQFKHQALHAFALEFIHPLTQLKMRFEAPLPADLEQLILTLRADKLCS